MFPKKGKKGSIFDFDQFDQPAPPSPTPEPNQPRGGLFDSIYRGTDAANIQVMKLSPGNAEFTRIAQFLHTAGRPKVISYISPRGRQRPRFNTYERGRWYFHGTLFAEASNLSRRGFSPKISAADNTFGTGLYLSNDIQKSLRYGNLVLMVQIPPQFSIASYSPSSRYGPSLPPPIANSPQFVVKLKKMGYDGIEVMPGVRVPNWSRKNPNTGDVVPYNELCVWNFAKVVVSYMVEF